MSQIIKPTVGRILHFRQSPSSAAIPAIVCCVHSDRCVNLAIFDTNGVPYTNPPTSVRLLQGDEETPGSGSFCEWMEYQKNPPSGSATAIANEASSDADNSNEATVVPGSELESTLTTSPESNSDTSDATGTVASDAPSVDGGSESETVDTAGASSTQS